MFGYFDEDYWLRDGVSVAVYSRFLVGPFKLYTLELINKKADLFGIRLVLAFRYYNTSNNWSAL